MIFYKHQGISTLTLSYVGGIGYNSSNKRPENLLLPEGVKSEKVKTKLIYQEKDGLCASYFKIIFWIDG